MLTVLRKAETEHTLAQPQVPIPGVEVATVYQAARVAQVRNHRQRTLKRIAQRVVTTVELRPAQAVHQTKEATLLRALTAAIQVLLQAQAAALAVVLLHTLRVVAILPALAVLHREVAEAIRREVAVVVVLAVAPVATADNRDKTTKPLKIVSTIADLVNSQTAIAL
jgi:hypothetical protein